MWNQSLLLHLSWLLAAASALACQCTTVPTAVEAWRGSPLVFAGTVEAASPPQARRHAFSVVTVRVDEPFRGAVRGQVVKLHQPFTSCSPQFARGQQYLFYLYAAEEPGVWVAGGCHRSRHLRAAAEDLLFLRALPASSTRTRLAGTVTIQDQPPIGDIPAAARTGLRVTVSGQGRSVPALTNADGVYEIYDLPPGCYSVALEVPPRLRIAFEGRNPACLTANGSASYDATLMPATRIYGRVLDAGGNAVDQVPVTLEAESGAAPPPVSVRTRYGGRFLFESIPAGRYRILANGARPLALAIADGEHRDGIIIRLP